MLSRLIVEGGECVRTGREPRTSGADGAHDMRLCELVARAHMARAQPTSIGNSSIALAAGSPE